MCTGGRRARTFVRRTGAGWSAQRNNAVCVSRPIARRSSGRSPRPASTVTGQSAYALWPADDGVPAAPRSGVQSPRRLGRLPGRRENRALGVADTPELLLILRPGRAKEDRGMSDIGWNALREAPLAVTE